MSHKSKLGLSIFVILLVAILTMAAASGWGGPLMQMDMPTDTVQPQATSALATPYGQNTPVPAGSDSQQNLPSPSHDLNLHRVYPISQFHLYGQELE